MYSRCSRSCEREHTRRVTPAQHFRPELARPRYPYFAAFVSKYIVTTIYSVQLTDHAGRAFLEATGREGQLIMRVRSRDHRLVSLAGAPTPMPDSLRLTMDVSMKYKAFRIGFRNLPARLV